MSLTWEKIPGSPRFSVLIATESWAGPGYEANVKALCSKGVAFVVMKEKVCTWESGQVSINELHLSEQNGEPDVMLDYPLCGVRFIQYQASSALATGRRRLLFYAVRWLALSYDRSSSSAVSLDTAICINQLITRSLWNSLRVFGYCTVALLSKWVKWSMSTPW